MASFQSVFRSVCKDIRLFTYAFSCLLLLSSRRPCAFFSNLFTPITSCLLWSLCLFLFSLFSLKTLSPLTWIRTISFGWQSSAGIVALPTWSPSVVPNRVSPVHCTKVLEYEHFIVICWCLLAHTNGVSKLCTQSCLRIIFSFALPLRNGQDSARSTVGAHAKSSALYGRPYSRKSRLYRLDGLLCITCRKRNNISRPSRLV